MKFHSPARLAAVAVVAALGLAACGSDNNSDSNAGGSGGSGGSGAAYCASGTLNTSGSTAQANAMTQWTKDYQTACGDATVNYNAVGSGQGVTDFTNAQTSMAGSDSALDPAKGEVDKANTRCKGGSAVDLPMVPGPIAVVYNVPGADNLVFTPQILAKIFSGKITNWNDAAIKAANSSAKLPDAKITTYHRSDSSGTSDNFTKYLLANDPTDWTYDHNKQWPGPGGQGAKGSDGVSAAIKGTANTIGYVEWSFATQNQLQTGQIDNGGGPVTLSAASVGKAVAAAKVTGTGDDLTLKLDYATKAAGAYPIILVTYEITCIKGLDAEQAKLVKGFLTYASSDGQSKLTALGYAPLPADLQSKVQAVVAKIS